MRIPQEEYKGRMESLQKQVREHDLDGFLVTSEESIYYLTGVTYKPLERPFFILVDKSKPSSLLVPALEQDHLAQAPNVGMVNKYWDYPAKKGEGWVDKLADMLTEVKNLGVEPTIPIEIVKELNSNTTIQSLPFIEKLRLQKSEAEINMLRQSARYSDMAIEKVIKSAYFGVSELELFSQARSVQMEIIKEIEYEALNTNLLAGAWPAPLSAQPHSVPTIYDRLESGPHIALALMRVNAYSTECERTFFLEKPTQELKEVFTIMLQARQKAFQMLKPGIRAGEIDSTVKDFLTMEGFGKNLLHRTGHGFGLGAHEGPWISEGSDDILQENMLVSIEPGIYLEGIGGIRHSDTILITSNGYESLTNYPTDLESLIITSKKPLARLKGNLMRKTLKIN